MQMEKKKVVVFQGDPGTIDLTREEMVEEWKRVLDRIPQIGEYRIVDPEKKRMTFEDYSMKIGDADAALGIWIHGGVIKEELFQAHPKLKYIATLGHGFEEFDVAMTRRYGVTITNTVYGDVTIAQYAMALLMNICHNVTLQSDYTKMTYWERKAKDSTAVYNKLLVPQIELYQKTMGIIGLGAIGRWTARMAQGFGMKVIANSRHVKTGPEYEGIEQVSMEELLKRSDVISIHCPHTKETEHLLNREAFSKMKDGVILINTARGAIIDEEALLEALESRKVYMAGLDVVDHEPPVEQIPLMRSPYTFITSHIAWQPRAARLRAVDMAGQNYRFYLEGAPRSVIN
ncbi:MAG TPA: D-2-hydroxyacid dehydrogenase [Candidatus Fusicatenibacter intestinigallinarum]|uniref:D-2-hydroxyacid dehydrogenase n=1 Tax=Candidatus Fusicatenibacter intestinigallinarum TaxID=2838598 RepID=A0A9D2N900_9FIRM|nr:D-2-hydroxyacid dehydrogenase [Candidatus Fusicatenibacter intestinigallinarum]